MAKLTDCDTTTDDLAQPVSYMVLAEATRDIETRMRREQAVHREAFELKMLTQMREFQADTLAQIAELVARYAEEVTAHQPKGDDHE